jgi:hypothetical protein
VDWESVRRPQRYGPAAARSVSGSLQRLGHFIAFVVDPAGHVERSSEGCRVRQLPGQLGGYLGDGKPKAVYGGGAGGHYPELDEELRNQAGGISPEGGTFLECGD